MLTLLRALMLFLLALVVCSCSTRPAPKPSLSPPTPAVVPVAPRGPSQADIDRMRQNQKEIAASQERNRLASDAARRDAEQRTKAYHQQREEEAQRKAATDRALEQLHMDRITRTVTVVVEASLLNPAGAKWGPASPALVESPHGSQLYHISGWVDSTNEFGATFRLNYLGAVRTRIVPDEYGRPTHEYTLESFVSYEQGGG